MTIPSPLHTCHITRVVADIAALSAKFKGNPTAAPAEANGDRLNPFSKTAIYKPNGDFHKNGQRVLRLKCQVLQLISNLFPCSEISPPKITLIGNGSYNVVLGVTIHPKNSDQKRDSGISFSAELTRLLGQPPKPRNFALRLPLDAGRQLKEVAMNNMHRDVATLSTAHTLLGAVIPDVVEYDVTGHNGVGRPYMLQTRLSGTNLNRLWHHLNLAQKVSAVTQLTKMVEKISAVTTSAPGYISFSNMGSAGSEILVDEMLAPTQLAPYEESEYKVVPYVARVGLQGRLAQSQTPMAYLLDQCDRWTQFEATLPYPSPRAPPLWTALKVVIRSLADKAWLGTSFHLAHNDLFARNVVVKVTGPSTVTISGVVDWDMACFAPRVVGLRAPFWAWKSDEADESDEDVARDPAAGEERIALKKAFLDAASPDFATFGLKAEAVVARKVWLLAVEGLLSESAKSMARSIVEEWGNMHPEDDVVETWTKAMESMVVKNEADWDN